MKSYISIQVFSNANKRVLFDRSIADCDLSSIPFEEIVSSLSYLFKDSSIVISSSLPKAI